MSARPFAIPGSGLSLALTSVWLPRLPPEGAELPEGYGIHLLHVPTGIYVNVRQLQAGAITCAAELEQMFASYADVSWPGAPRTVATWSAGSLHGVTGVFDGAIPDSIVREWVLSDGTSLANAATFATAAQWRVLLPACESLIRTIRFD